MDTKYLSRFIVCSNCDKAPATHTVKDETGKVIRYLCDKCAATFLHTSEKCC